MNQNEPCLVVTHDTLIGQNKRRDKLKIVRKLRQQAPIQAMLGILIPEDIYADIKDLIKTLNKELNGVLVQTP